ncbi:MAG: hypothetical protein ACYDDP_05935 [Acidithiobacillus sp.]
MPEVTSNPQFLTVRQFTEKQPAFTAGGIRSLLFYRGDDAEKSGAVVRFGRRVLIDEPRFLSWVREGGAKHIRGAA